MITFTFEPINGNSVSIQDIVPEGAGGYGDVVFQTISDDGIWNGEYAYWTEENLGEQSGWYDSEMNYATATIAYKQAVFAQAGAGVTLTYSGQVATGEVSVSLPNGYSMTGNATPVDITLSSIVPEGDGVGGFGDVVIQTLNDAGTWAGEYAWWTEENLGETTGWYDSDMNPANATITSGEGVFVQTASEDVVLKYPAAL